MATFRGAAIKVLQDAKEPLTPRQITKRAIKLGLLEGARSKDPVATMYGVIIQRQKAAKRGAEPEFVPVGGGRFRLGSRDDSGVPPKKPTKTHKTPSSYVGKAGEHLVIAELLLKKFNANTMSIDEGIDVVATWGDLVYAFQVKTANLSNGTYSYNIPIKSFLKTDKNYAYYAFVLLDGDAVDFLVLPYLEVKKQIAQGGVYRLKKQQLYSVSITKKGDKLYLGNQNNDVTFYRRQWPSHGISAHDD